MLKSILVTLMIFSSANLFAHHARCTNSDDGLMTCGAHAGPVAFYLHNYGDITTETKQVVLCNNKGVAVEELKIMWVESEDESTHFEMEGAKFSNLNDSCVLIGNLNFVPHEDFIDSAQNAWKIDIMAKDFPFPSSVYIEAIKK